VLNINPDAIMAPMKMRETIEREFTKCPIVSNTVAVIPPALLDQKSGRDPSYSVLFKFREEFAAVLGRGMNTLLEQNVYNFNLSHYFA
jgi:hypothetical protein